MSYWSNRNLKAREALLDKTIAEIEKELTKQYKKTAEKMIAKIENLYLELQASKKDDTLLVSDLYKFNKYYDTLDNLNKELVRLGAKEERLLNSKFKILYKNNAKLLSEELGINSSVNRKAVKEAVNSVWCADGKSWSDRVWVNKSLLKSSLEETLVNGIATGISADKLTKELMVTVGANYNNASRLVRTELSHVYNKSTQDKYKEAGVKEYQWLTAEDERTCKECNELDGKKFKIDDTDNLPPKHPNCRCTILVVLDDKRE